MAERRDQVPGGLVTFAAHAEAAVDDLLEMIAAGQLADITAADRAGDVAPQQHHGDQADLVDVIALLPAAHSAPGDLVGHVEQVESVGGDATMAELVGRDPEVAELQLLLVAHEDVERREVPVQRLSPVQPIEDPQDARQLAPHEALGLGPFALEPRAEVAMLRILHDEAVARAGTIDADEAVED